MQLHITDAAMPDAMVLTVSGAVTFADVDEIELALVLAQAADIRDLTIDMTSVTSIDSVGLGILLRAQEQVEARGGQMQLVATPAHVAVAIRQTGLDRMLTLPVRIPRQAVRCAAPRVPQQR